MSTLIAAGLTHVGCVRDHNEDAYCVDSELQVFIVADGMGGHAAGEVASKMAVDGVAASWTAPTIQEQVSDYASKGDVERRRRLLRSMRDAVMKANQAIADVGESDEGKKGMGTTLTGFLIAGGEAMFAHAGDSRAYLVRDRIPLLLSEDHTILSRLRAAGIDRGIAGPEPVRYKGMLTNALGMADTTRVSTFVLPLFSGDQLILSSDGIHDYVTEVEYGELVERANSPEQAAQSLVDLALERGGEDNATVVVVSVTEAGATEIPADLRRRHDDAIAACPLFAGLSAQQILRALRITTPRRYKKGTDLPRVALEDRVAYIVLEGELAGSGIRAKAGDVALVEALVQETVVSEASISATTDIQVLMIRRNDFIELCDDDLDLGVLLYDTVAGLLKR